MSAEHANHWCASIERAAGTLIAAVRDDDEHRARYGDIYFGVLREAGRFGRRHPEHWPFVYAAALAASERLRQLHAEQKKTGGATMSAAVH